MEPLSPIISFYHKPPSLYVTSPSHFSLIYLPLQLHFWKFWKVQIFFNRPQKPKFERQTSTGNGGENKWYFMRIHLGSFEKRVLGIRIGAHFMIQGKEKRAILYLTFLFEICWQEISKWDSNNNTAFTNQYSGVKAWLKLNVLKQIKGVGVEEF